MACSENKDSENDLEVRDTLTRNFDDVLQDSESKSLSPILGGGSATRKFLIGRRLKNKRSRVKLSDRFKEKETGSSKLTHLKEETIEFSEDSFTVSQNDNLINQIEKLEEIENNRNKIYTVLVSGGRNSTFCFKKPLSPPPLNESKKVKISSDDNSTMESEILVEHVEHTSSVVDVSATEVLPNCSGFQTAAGKTIPVLEDDVKRHSKLFDDIIYDYNKQGDVRKKKYAFLSKSKSDICIKKNSAILDINSTASESDLSGNKFSKRSLNTKEVKFESCMALEGFKDVCSVDAKSSSNDKHISLTQEICESGISNTQMLTAADEVLSSMDKSEQEAEFKGFNKDEITLYEDVYQHFVNAQRMLQTNNRKCSRRSIFSITKSNLISTNKRVAKDLPLPPKKRIKSVDSLENVTTNTENKENLGLSNFAGFSTASGKRITVTDSSLSKAKDMFEGDIGLSEITSEHGSSNLLHGDTIQSISDVSESDNTVTDSSMSKINNLSDIDPCLPTNIKGVKSTTSILENVTPKLPNAVTFSSASGKSIPVSEKALQNAKEVYENLSSCLTLATTLVSRDQKVAKGKIEILETIPETSEDESCPSSKANSMEQPTIVKPLLQPLPSVARVKNIFADFDFSDIKPLGNWKPPVASGFQTSKKPLGKMSNTPLQNSHKMNLYQEKHIAYQENPPAADTTVVKKDDSKHKKRLGVSSCKLLQISNSKLEKARLIFDEDFSKLSPMRPKENNVYASTPIRQNVCATPGRIDLRTPTSVAQAFCSTPVRQQLSKPANRFSSFLDGTAITPIKPIITTDQRPGFASISDQLVTLTSPTKGDVVEWLTKLQEDRERLERRLEIILERQRMMENLKKEKSDGDKRPINGVLYRRKATSNRISLEFFVDNKRPGEESMNYELFEINPENAEYVHFKEQHSSVITTEDGATVVPNINDVVGISEIELAFKAMPGVDPQLIPKGWIRNHYKWTIWKLTSYARMFPDRFRTCLNVENIMQQLKYRYDREIDRAERSALRKIFEKDDAPQKRLVLCVSRVKELNPNEYELELTDGWYGIRTIIDEALNIQVSKGRLHVGTKLLISGAELLYCDGCYPLEATAMTCLKISYNSSRRAHWNTRLGYQRNPEPFPIPIQCVHPLGGPIGAIKVRIVRTYPFKYLENWQNCSVWRNKKAEERRAQQWETERFRKLEQIRENVKRELENSYKNHNSHSKKYRGDPSGRVSPKTLCEELENSDDPERLQKNLSSSQRAEMLDYQNNLRLRKEQEMEEKIKEDMNKLRLSARNVVPVFKILVSDVRCSSERGFNFFVWRPGESHTQMLREGTVVTIQNVLPKKNGDLNSYSKTRFKPEPSTPLCSDFKRRAVEIPDLFRSTFSPAFNEFDTVGLVVYIQIEVSCQEIWLTDELGRLLLVNIHEGSTTCLLLDNLRRGQATSVCNLIHRGVTDNVAQAVANHFTIFSSYSQYKHLQEGLEMFKRRLPKDVNTLLNSCDRKIDRYRMKLSDVRNAFSTIFEEEEEDESTLISSRLTSTDVALSLIDIDKYT